MNSQSGQNEEKANAENEDMNRPSKREKRNKTLGNDEKKRIVRWAIVQSLLKLDPRHTIKNPVMFVVEIGSAITSLLFILALFGYGEASAAFIGLISVWLWFTVVFANYSEALAEGRGKAQADALRKMRTTTIVKKLNSDFSVVKGHNPSESEYAPYPSTDIRKGDLYFVQGGDIIPI
jgi:K+-transporting ATPase ATPase B chain